MSAHGPELALDCEDCGYVLTGLSRRAGEPLRCPECGRLQHRALARAPWPHWAWVVLLLCGPHTALVAGVVVVVAARWTLVFSPLIPTAFIGWLLLMFVAPAHYAGELARRHGLRPAHGRIALGLTLAAWAGNAVLAGLIVLLAGAIRGH